MRNARFEKRNVTYLIASTRDGGVSIFFLRDKFLRYSTVTFQISFDLMFLSSITINGNPSNERTNAHGPARCIRFCAITIVICLWHVTARWRFHKNLANLVDDECILRNIVIHDPSFTVRSPQAQEIPQFRYSASISWPSVINPHPVEEIFAAHHHESSQMLQRVEEMSYSSIASNIFYCRLLLYWKYSNIRIKTRSPSMQILVIRDIIV